jgi:hypothetical protein
MIKEILDKLKPDEKRLLMYAFEQDYSQFVRVNTSQFIGVNCHCIKNLEIIESAGKWSIGNIKELPKG